MKKVTVTWVFVLLLSSLFPPFSHAAETELSLSAQPLRYAVVHGDPEKFREQNWLKEGYTGGIEDFELEETNLPEDLSVSMKGRAIVRNNDYEGEVHIDKKNFGFVHLDYQEFSKYYDGSGGVYYPFSVLKVNDLDRELELEIGHFGVEAGLTFENLPQISFLYERHFKEGTKSRLTWTSVREGIITKKIGPSWQEIDEVVDTFAIRENHTLKGFEIKGEQRWEQMRSEMSREEKDLSITATASDRRIRLQEQNPQSRLFTNTAAVERWFRDERVFAGGAYHYLTMSSQEIENILEMNENRNLTNFNNPKQVRNATADNEYHAHTWVGNFMFSPWSWLSVITKFKGEAAGREGDSRYPQDTTANVPDGIINNTEISITDNKVAKAGEGVTLRYTGIPRTALYHELEFEQVRNWISEDRNSLRGQSAPNANEIFQRETITYIRRLIWTLGGHFAPWNLLDLTAHWRLHTNDNDYEDERETNPGANTARSAFMDGLNIMSRELATKISLKPARWLRPAFRYHFLINDYASHVEDESVVKTAMNSHIFTFDLALQPTDKLMILTSFSPQYAWVETPARNQPVVNTPRFQANVRSWFLNANYDIHPRLSLTSGLELSVADNFEDFTAGGLPLAAAYDLLKVSGGLRWALNQYLGLETGYDFYQYDGQSVVDSGDYEAHLLWLKTILNWE